MNFYPDYLFTNTILLRSLSFFAIFSFLLWRTALFLFKRFSYSSASLSILRFSVNLLISSASRVWENKESKRPPDFFVDFFCFLSLKEDSKMLFASFFPIASGASLSSPSNPNPNSSSPESPPASPKMPPSDSSSSSSSDSSLILSANSPFVAFNSYFNWLFFTIIFYKQNLD